jgi:hypothetical protein
MTAKRLILKEMMEPTEIHAGNKMTLSSTLEDKRIRFFLRNA